MTFFPTRSQSQSVKGLWGHERYSIHMLCFEGVARSGWGFVYYWSLLALEGGGGVSPGSPKGCSDPGLRGVLLELPELSKSLRG